MKIYLLSMFLSVFSYASLAQDCTTQLATEDYTDTFHTIDNENDVPYVPGGAWYWDPDESGVGMSIAIQLSKHGGGGYQVFGAFFTYKPSGEQAWYTVQGTYTPDENVNDWREDLERFGTTLSGSANERPDGIREWLGFGGCYWGNSETRMGELNAFLAETKNGPVLDGATSVGEIFAYKPVKMVWLNPNEIEIYIDGESTPSHTFQRMTMHGDLRKGDADYLTEGYYHLDLTTYGILPPFVIESKAFYTSVATGNFSFDKLNIDEDFPDAEEWAVDRFKNFTEYNEHKDYYITSQPIVSYVYQGFWNRDDSEEATWEPKAVPNYEYLVMVYDKSTLMLEGYQVQTFDAANSPSITKGLFVSTGFRFKGYLPSGDQGRISLYPAACYHCHADYDLRKEVIRRSALNLYQIPDMGEAFAKMPMILNNDFNVEAGQ